MSNKSKKYLILLIVSAIILWSVAFLKDQKWFVFDTLGLWGEISNAQITNKILLEPVCLDVPGRRTSIGTKSQYTIVYITKSWEKIINHRDRGCEGKSTEEVWDTFDIVYLPSNPYSYYRSNGYSNKIALPLIIFSAMMAVFATLCLSVFCYKRYINKKAKNKTRK